MSLPAPLSRYYRDDITVSVIFLGNTKAESVEDGGVFVNDEATAGGARTLRAKL
jgi:pyruvate dehydrogenase phosphatase